MTLIPYAGKDDSYEVPYSMRFRMGAHATRNQPKPDRVHDIAYPEPKPGASPKPVIDIDKFIPRILAEFRSRGMPLWAREIVVDVSERTGVALGLIASKSRTFRVVHARNEAIYLIKDRSPCLSTPIMGRWFNRDHTAILHSIASHSERTGAPNLVGYNVNRARRLAAAHKAWKRKKSEREAS